MGNFITLIKSIMSGLVTGIGICIPLGPAGIESIKRTINENFFEGFKVSLGAISADMTYLLIINLGLSSLFLRSKKTEGLFWIVSGLILFAFTLFSTGKENREAKCPGGKDSICSHPFPTGFVITFLNPLTPSLWIALTGTVLSVWRLMGYVYFATFIFSILCGMIFWFALLNYLASRGVKMLKPDTTDKTSILLKYVLLILGIAFVILGIIKILI